MADALADIDRHRPDPPLADKVAYFQTDTNRSLEREQPAVCEECVIITHEGHLKTQDSRCRSLPAYWASGTADHSTYESTTSKESELIEDKKTAPSCPFDFNR